MNGLKFFARRKQYKNRNNNKSVDELKWKKYKRKLAVETRRRETEAGLKTRRHNAQIGEDCFATPPQVHTHTQTQALRHKTHKYVLIQ